MQQNAPATPHNIATIVLAGGEGTRLFPLTQSRCKPAVNFAGRYRLIDIPISNALNAQFHNIYVISQYLASTLNKHVIETYPLDRLQGGHIECLTPEKDPTHKVWFKGTADAVRQNLKYLKNSAYDYFLILSGDQLYNMNLSQMVNFAIEKDADLTIAALPIGKEDAKRMGLLKIDPEFAITSFVEKPQDPQVLHHYKIPEHLSKPIHLKGKTSYLGSMGIYFFKKSALEKLLEIDDREDFGKHLIPTQIMRGKTYAYVYDGYWEDIGTIGSYYRANLGLTTNSLGLNFYNEHHPIVAQATNLPPARISGTRIDNSVICDGSIINAAEISHSMVGLRSHIGKDCIIKESVLVGNQFYAPPAHHPTLPSDFTIGEGCRLEGVIVDEHARIGHHVTLINKEKRDTYDGPHCYIRDGIIVVPSGADIPDYFTL